MAIEPAFSLRDAPRGRRRLVDQRSMRTASGKKRLPRRSEAHSAIRSLEQASANLIFEKFDLPRNRRLRHVQALCRSTKVAFFAYSDEAT
jgi:hypothetical protein